MRRRGGVADRFDAALAKVAASEQELLEAMQETAAESTGDDADAPSAGEQADMPATTLRVTALDADDTDTSTVAAADRTDGDGEDAGPAGTPPAALQTAEPGDAPAIGTVAEPADSFASSDPTLTIPPGASASADDGRGDDVVDSSSSPPRRPPAPIAKVSDDPDAWRALDHALARNADDPSQWDRSTFRTSAWLADGLATTLKRRKRTLRNGGGERLQFAATDRHMRKVLSLQLLTNLPLGDTAALRGLLRRGFEEGWFEEDEASAYLEVTTEMRDALEAVVTRLRQDGLKRVGLRHVQILALIYGIDPDEPVVPRAEAQARLERLLR